jgi:predicted RecA/RadA family phage recombinase
MKNYIQEGSIIAVTAPTGGVISGEGLIVGSLFGAALHSAAEGESLEVATDGVYRLPKASTVVLAIGTRVAWDNSAKNINVLGTGRFPVGIAAEAAGNGITSVAVRLDGVATVAA